MRRLDFSPLILSMLRYWPRILPPSTGAFLRPQPFTEGEVLVVGKDINGCSLRRAADGFCGAMAGVVTER